MSVPGQDWVAKWAGYTPDKVAFKEYESGQTLTFLQLHHAASAVATWLTRDPGLKPGDRLCVIAENCLEYIILFSAIQKTGIILVPLNYRLVSAELDYVLRDADPAVLIFEEKFLSQIAEADAFPNIKHRFSLEEVSRIAAEYAAPFETLPVQWDDPVFILYTSGTTGRPKGALYTHRMMFWNSINTSMSLIVNADSRTVNCMPPFHTGGWNVLTTPFLHHGGYTCLIRKFDPEIVLQLIESEQVTVFMGVPTMLNMIAQLPEFERARFDHLLYLIVGGEPMPIPLIEKWHSRGVPIRQGFGMTEVGPNLTSLHHEDAIPKKGSIGRVNYYVDIRIVDEAGKDVAPGERGELLLGGPVVTPGYWRNDEATAKAIRDGWFHSGDVVIRDSEGYIYVVDRIKHMFISGGENVYPAELERVILEHPLVSEVAVIGVADATWGEVGHAFVVLVDGATCSETELTDFCRLKLAKFKIPKHFVLMDALPRTATGKIDRQFLTAKNQ